MDKLLPTTVTTVSPSGETQIKTINYYNSSDRKWLASHCYWALHNNHIVTTQKATNRMNQSSN